jgi:6-phospho-beta-glucosidase
VALHAKMDLTKVLEQLLNIPIDPSRTQLKTLGLNHLTWHSGFTLDGEEMWPRIMQHHLAELRADPDPEWDVRTIESLHMLPNYYLQYFYYTQHKLAEQQQWPPSRAEAVMAIEDDLLRQYAEPDRSEPPADLMKRGGAYYSTVATQLLNAHYNDLGETHVANVRHNGAVPGWPFDWVLELPCRVDRSGVHPLPAEPLPPVCFGVLAQVKAYELLTVEAAVHGDRNAAYQALLANPLGPSADKIQIVLNDLLETHRGYLPQFWPE